MGRICWAQLPHTPTKYERLPGAAQTRREKHGQTEARPPLVFSPLEKSMATVHEQEQLEGESMCVYVRLRAVQGTRKTREREREVCERACVRVDH